LTDCLSIYPNGYRIKIYYSGGSVEFEDVRETARGIINQNSDWGGTIL
jgi:hypothetical protein